MKHIYLAIEYSFFLTLKLMKESRRRSRILMKTEKRTISLNIVKVSTNFKMCFIEFLQAPDCI